MQNLNAGDADSHTGLVQGREPGGSIGEGARDKTMKDENDLLPKERCRLQKRRRPLRPISIAVLLLAVGGLLTLLLPPVGVVIMLTGALVFVWGLFGAARAEMK
jgi:hypothetical protein